MTDTTDAEVIDFTGTPTTGATGPGAVAVPELAEVVDGEVVDAEIVDEAAVSRPPSVVQVVIVRPVEVIKVVMKHDHTKTAAPEPDVHPAGCAGRGQARVGQPQHSPL